LESKPAFAFSSYDFYKSHKMKMLPPSKPSKKIATKGEIIKDVGWGVKNSFFAKRILLFINNLQILRKTGIFVPVFAFQKANRN